jgi:HAD superfamily hydrolase (TIGR01549 family)
MLRAVIFDVDGTIVDSNELHVQAWDEIFRRYGKHFSREQLHEHIGEGGDQYVPNFLNAIELREFGAKLEKERGELYKEKYMPKVRPFPRVRELFERIRRDDKRVALASSGKTDELEHYTSLCKIESLVDTQTTKDDVAHSKPHADVFIAALRKLGSLSSDEAIVVGDSPYDVIAAKRLMLPTVGLLCGGFSEEELRSVGAIAIFRDAADLLENYERSPLAG